MKKNKNGLLPSIPLSKTTDPSIANKLIQEKSSHEFTKNRNNQYNLNKMKEIEASGFEDVSKDLMSRRKIIKDIISAHPDIELAAQILTSSILSPKDLIKTSLYYKSTSTIVSALLSHNISKFIEKEMSSKYKLEDELYDIVLESYITVGSYSRLIIPDSKLNELVNDSALESLGQYADRISDRILPLDQDTKPIMSYMDNLSIVTDTSILNLHNEYSDTIEEVQFINNNVTLEAIGDVIEKKKKKKNVAQIFKVLNKDKKSEKIDLTTYEINNERCLSMKIPAEAVIPLHFTSDYSKHFGYYILLDGNGSPIKSYNINDDKELTPVELMNKIIAKAKSNLNKLEKEAPKLKNADKVLAHKINEKLINSIEKKMGSLYITDDDKDLLLRTVLNRVLDSKNTKILYVPASQLSYYAFNFRENGTGEPILDDLGVTSSLRTMIKFSKIAALVRNSIPNTHVDVTLDENDPDATKTIESIRAYVMNTRSMSLPVGLMRTSDTVDWLHKYGFSFNFKHPDLPNMEISTSETSKSYVEPDDTLEENLKHSMYMRMGLSPEMVDNSYSADFAATVISQNALQAKRIMRLQNKLNAMITKDVIKLVRNDGFIKSRIYKMIEDEISSIAKNSSDEYKNHMKKLKVSKSDMVEYVFEDYLATLSVTLPEVEMEENGTKEAFEAFKNSVDDYIESFLSTDALPEEYAGTINENVDMLQQAVKHSLIRRWMDKNNFMPELSNLFSLSDIGEIDSSVLEEYDIFMNNLTEALNKFKKKNKKSKKRLNKASEIPDVDEEDNETNNTNSVSTNDDNNTDSDTADGNELSDDNFDE